MHTLPPAARSDLSSYHIVIVDPETLDLIERAAVPPTNDWDYAVTLAQAETSKPGEGLVQILEVTPEGQGVIHRLFCGCGVQYHCGHSRRH
jgi:hypothetical protein